jgi:hypothetical protein
VAFCADSFRDLAGSGDDRDGRKSFTEVSHPRNAGLIGGTLYETPRGIFVGTLPYPPGSNVPGSDARNLGFELAEREMQFSRMNTELAARVDEVKQLQGQIRSIRASICWRLTWPIRYLHKQAMVWRKRLSQVFQRLAGSLVRRLK